MNKILLICLLLLMLLIGGYITILIKKQSITVDLINNKNDKLSNNIETLKYNIIDSWSFERKTLNIDRISDEDGQKLRPFFFEFEKPILIFRFSKVDCSDCVISQIRLLKEIFNESQIKYMIIADYSNKRSLGFFKRSNGINNHVYNCEEMIDGEIRTPYFCVYSKGVISNIFFPDDDFQELNKCYINKMREMYFN